MGMGRRYGRKKSLSGRAIILALALVLVAVGIYALANVFKNNGAGLPVIGKTSGTVSKDTRTCIVIDAGHGDDDPGTSYGDILEKDLNLSIAKKVQVLLEAKNYRVVMTRTNDTLVPLYDRAAIGSREGHIFVSIHQNSMENDSTVNGMETWYNENTNPLSQHLARSVQQEAVAATGAGSLGLKTNTNFVVIRETKVPSCLFETGYLSNKKDRENVVTDAYQDKVARGIVKGIERFFEEYGEELKK